MNNTKPKISVVIPVYKVEEYIHQCIDSVINQTYTNLEIILVDDGSPDNCGAICDEYAAADERIKVIHQENQGLSMARNNGIKIATGKYFGCVDSDDYIQPKMYEIMVQAMLENDLEVVECSMQKGSKIYFDQEKGKVFIETFDEALERIVHPGFFNVMNKLYNYKLIENIPFVKGKIYEDIIFNSEVWKKIDKIGFVPLALYYYNQEGESIMRSSYSTKKIEGYWVIKEAIENFKKKATTKRGHELLRKNFLRTTLYHFHSLLENKNVDPIRENSKKLRKLIRENSVMEYNNPYFTLINILPFSLYRVFFKINLYRLKNKAN